MTQLSAHQSSLARSRAYTLLGRLFLAGLTPELHALLLDVAGLSGLLPDPYDADEAAARHQQLLGFEHFPFQSFFLDTTGLVGGAESMRVQESYATLGFSPPDDVAPDHLGVELLTLAHLTGAEADAHQDGLEETAERMQQLQQQFLADHLARWIMPVSVALDHAGGGLYAGAAAVAREMVADQWDERADASGMSAAFPPAERPNPQAPSTTIQELATFLLTPVRSGLFISQADLRVAGRALNLPGGFGSRKQRLLNMIRTAVAYELFPEFVARLDGIVEQHESSYEAVEQSTPALVAVWSSRAGATRTLLQQLQQMAGALEDEEEPS